MINIKFDDYGKMIDIILSIGKLSIKMTLNLKGSEKSPYHSEYRISNGDNNSITIKRNMSYLLLIEIIDDIIGKENIVISKLDFAFFKKSLNDVSKFYDANRLNETFGRNSMGDLKVIKNASPTIIGSLAQNKTISVYPSINDNNGKQNMGVIIKIDNAYQFITIKHFYSFVDFINSIDMHMYASQMSLYVGRPSYGHNLIEIQNNYTQTEKSKVRLIEGL